MKIKKRENHEKAKVLRGVGGRAQGQEIEASWSREVARCTIWKLHALASLQRVAERDRVRRRGARSGRFEELRPRGGEQREEGSQRKEKVDLEASCRERSREAVRGMIWALRRSCDQGEVSSARRKEANEKKSRGPCPSFDPSVLCEEACAKRSFTWTFAFGLAIEASLRVGSAAARRLGFRAATHVDKGFIELEDEDTLNDAEKEVFVDNRKKDTHALN
ncbi:hypothetical protein ZIOFF_065982 [Zingiber officinale]|uniref:Uncharacterized protein n=1 Tax=Zingiber officinale TaxID=94328 RepID=A0A8J5EYU6_ZINOF|nr:hypothetical protein ZIOFF_065982 [Zingiber officinale]